jgi:hypothetical protein
MDDMEKYQRILEECQSQIGEAREEYEKCKVKEDYLSNMSQHLVSKLTLQERQHSSSLAEAERRAKGSEQYKEHLLGLLAAGELKASAAGVLERLRTLNENTRSLLSAEKEKMKIL